MRAINKLVLDNSAAVDESNLTHLWRYEAIGVDYFLMNSENLSPACLNCTCGHDIIVNVSCCSGFINCSKPVTLDALIFSGVEHG